MNDEIQLQAGDRLVTGLADVAANEIIRDKLHPLIYFYFVTFSSLELPSDLSPAKQVVAV